MKKQLLCGVLAVTMVMTSAAAFSDITQTPVAQAASVLDSLGIMQGDGAGRFNPQGQLTRAQFCKMAVTALGVDDVSPFANYTVFPDVPSTYWAAGYINAAVKQTSIKDKKIIRGYANGTFGPDHALTYAETCTMLLRMLGFQVADVGPFWPTDYIAKAKSLGLLTGVSGYGASDLIRRGDAAVMLLNTLQATPKEGAKLLLSTVASNTLEDAILLGTSQTDSGLHSGQARFYVGGSVSTRTMAVALDKSLVGARGTVLFDKEAESKVRAFVPDNGEMDTITVQSATTTKLTATDGRGYEVPRDVSTVINGAVNPFNTAYFDLVDRTVNIYYNSNHVIDLISVTSGTVGNSTFVYGTSSASNLPNDYKITKNGAIINRSQVKRYDLVTVNSEAKTASVTDKRVTGYLLDAKPSYQSPSTVTMLGNTYPISQAAAFSFKGMKYQDKVTLLIDDYGTVRAAYPASVVSGSMMGVFSMNGTKAVVTLINGAQISGELKGSATDSIGRLVTATPDKDGGLSVIPYNATGKVAGDWVVADGRLGSAAVSSNVKVYEMSGDNASVTPIERGDVGQATVPANSIRSTVSDTSGSIIAIILSDYTGSGWQYGFANGVPSTNAEGDPVYNVKFITYQNGASVTRSYVGDSQSSGVSGIIGLPKGIDGATGAVRIPTKTLNMVQNIAATAFDGENGVQTTQGYFPIADDVGVYVKDYNKMISLQEARANFSSFTLYVDASAANGGMVRILTAN